MLKPNIEYLKFDDRKFVVLGTVVLSLLVPALFFGLSFQDNVDIFFQQVIESLMYTSVYWLSLRELMIYLRRKYQQPKPDLIFLDIQLSDGSSFEIFKQVEVKSPIVFTTAYDQYAIDAFKVNSIDYLLKPIHIDDLGRAIQKFEEQQLSIPQNLSEQLQQIFRQEKLIKKHRCLVKKGSHFEYINVSDIAFVVSEDGMTFLHTFQGKRFIYAKTLESFMSELEARTFFQINWSQILNINAI